jgi:hypothetical protein
MNTRPTTKKHQASNRRAGQDFGDLGDSIANLPLIDSSRFGGYVIRRNPFASVTISFGLGFLYGVIRR